MTYDIKVSISCITYNHEPYIRDCLEGFVNQKTNFRFEVLIHDDASTDKTADIIREYAAKYPDIIKTIYQSENQYSKGIGIFKTFIYPRIQGKYIALCEGDDYWCDEYKLQKQVDFLESHSDCVGCVSGTKILNYMDDKKESLYYPTEKSRYVTVGEAVENGMVYPTASFIFRTNCLNKDKLQNLNLGFGDYTRILDLCLQGRIYAFHEIFTVYRYGVPGSWTQKNLVSLEGKIADRNKNEILYNKFNELTDNAYIEHTKRVLVKKDFEILRLQGNFKEMKKEPYREIYKRQYGIKPRTQRCIMRLAKIIIPKKAYKKLAVLYKRLKGAN